MGTVLLSTRCHYCGKKANTQDHIVPRCDLPPGAVQPYWFRSQNVVPACKTCNGDKGCLRSDCTCPHCTWAWGTAKGLYGVVERGYVKIVHEGWKVA